MKKTTIVKYRSVVLVCGAFILARTDDRFLLPYFPIAILICAFRFALALVAEAIIDALDKKESPKEKTDGNEKKK